MSIAIRLARPDDTAAIATIYAPYVTDTVISFETVSPDEHEMAHRLAKTLARFPWLVAMCDGEVAGYAYAGQHRERAAYQWSADVSVYVHKDFQRRGIGRALYTSLFAILRALGYYNVYAGIALPNPASVALHEAMGMTPVGVYRHVGYKGGMWHDVGWWEGSLRQQSAEPHPPRALLDVASDTIWDGWLTNGELLARELRAQP
ncbi:MAG TPA: arsinothricin resistance N-acetyltransferase ArsN1 family B [Ktedonobacterales bacterium]|nr:arsinothricin resistance N-acetyltransferase ArsN1 family B [Ktedonobacterales bacterium]